MRTRLVAVVSGDFVVVLTSAIMVSKGIIQPWPTLSVLWSILLVSNYIILSKGSHEGGTRIPQQQRSSFMWFAWLFLVFCIVVVIVSITQILHGNSDAKYQLLGALVWIALLLWLINRRKRVSQS